jgi:ABC-type branched-subunit amino acid transport system substrate-binding protein
VTARAARPRLLLELGRGGMGVVYLAREAGDGGRLVVVKHLKADLARDPDARQMLVEEARITARVSHPNVVTTFENGFDGKHYYIVMEYLEGHALDALLRDAGSPLPTRLGVHVVARALEGLHTVHELRGEDGRALEVVHRDVSPHNVFVTYDGAVKVLDFGIAKAADSSARTRTGVVKGKATYMAPEQAIRAHVDRRTDVFAAGVILWEVLARRRLWGELSEDEIFAALGRGALEPPSSVQPDTPAALEAACMRALARDPAERFQTADAMREALDAWLADGGGPVSREELGGYVAERFAEERERLAREVTTVDARGVVPGDEEAIPLRGFSGTYALNVSSTRGPTRRRRTRALAVAAGVVAAVAVASGVVIVRSRSSTPVPVAASVSVAPGARGCAHNADCAREGTPSICRANDGVCVALESEDCRVRAGPTDVGNDATIWFGTMFPLTGPDAPTFGTANADAVELARRELMEVAQGLPPARPGGPTRPLGIVSCDDAVDPLRAATHLVDDVGVPAVIGFHGSDEVLKLASALFIPRGVMAVSALNRSPLLRDIPHPAGSPRLIWRTSVSSAQSAPATAALVSEWLEPALRRQGAVPAGTSMRVALLRDDTNTSRAVTDGLVSRLRFNGKSVVDNAELFHDFAVPQGPDAAGHKSVGAAMARFAPDVVVFIGRESVLDVIEPLEQEWPRGKANRPYYVFGAPWEGEALLRFIGHDAARRRRFLGMAPTVRTPANLRFVQRFNAASAQKVTLADAPNNAYDAFYLLAYAVVAAGDAPPSGEAIARAVPRLLPPAPTIEVGSGGIFPAMRALAAGEHIDVDGASGRLDFDVQTGEAEDDLTILCIGVDDKTGAAAGGVESGLVYDAVTRTLRGRLHCP